MIATSALLLAGTPMPPPALQGPPVAVVNFDINAQAYRMLVPTSYCEPVNKPDAAKGEETNAEGYTLAKPVFLIPCKLDAQGGGQNFLYLKYLKGRRVKAKDRADFVASTASILSKKFDRWQDAEKFIADAEEKTEAETGQDIAVSGSAKALGHDLTCIYTGVKLMVTDNAKKSSTLLVTCTTLVDKNLVTIDISEAAGPGTTYVGLMRRLNEVANSIAAQP